MSCHWQLLPTLALTLQDGRGQSVLLCVSARIRTGREDYQNVPKRRKKANKQDVHCGLSGPLCAQISPLFAIIAPIAF